MRTDMPVHVQVFQRYGFCLPYSRLLFWAYIKLISASLLLGYYSFVLNYVINVFAAHKETTLMNDIVMTSVIVSTLILDAVLHSVFIVLTYKKCDLILNVYYFCALTLLVISFLLGIVNFDLMIKNMVNHGAEHHGNLFVMKTTAMFINLLFQAHLILLVRSEIVNHKVTGSFRFIKTISGSEVTLQCESLFVGKEKLIIVQETNLTE